MELSPSEGRRGIEAQNTGGVGKCRVSKPSKGYYYHKGNK